MTDSAEGMEMQADTTGGVLEDLIETLEDGHRGFAQVADKLEGDSYRNLVEKMRQFSQQRATFSQELRSVATTHGYEISEKGSVGGSLHRGWISLKDALTGDDPSAIVGAAETGEDHAVTEYEEALAKDLPGDVKTVIARQATEIQRAHDEVKVLRDSL